MNGWIHELKNRIIDRYINRNIDTQLIYKEKIDTQKDK